MITTDFVQGSPCWLDLGAPDVAASAAFYGAVLGWEHQPYGPEADGYGLFKMNGRTVGAIGPLSEEGARSAWMVYFKTADTDATARDVERLGGTVRAAPFDIDGHGRMAQFSDPQGAQFAVWQSGKTGGLEAVDEAGTLSWIELCTLDAAGAMEFYRGLFGWSTQDMPMPGGGGGMYTLLTPAGLEQERMHGGMVQVTAEQLPLTGGRPYWHPVFAVTDCDATLAKVNANDGNVIMGPEDAEGVGRLAVCTDRSGAEFVLLTPAES